MKRILDKNVAFFAFVGLLFGIGSGPLDSAYPMFDNYDPFGIQIFAVILFAVGSYFLLFKLFKNENSDDEDDVRRYNTISIGIFTALFLFSFLCFNYYLSQNEKTFWYIFLYSFFYPLGLLGYQVYLWKKNP